MTIMGLFLLFIVLLLTEAYNKMTNIVIRTRNMQNQMGKGFGKESSADFEGFLAGLAPSQRPGDSKKLGGRYGELLERQLEAFADIKGRGVPVTHDLYCRLRYNICVKPPLLCTHKHGHRLFLKTYMQ